MKRNELETGNRYAGPGGKCYEIVDLSPGWRISTSGEWVEDTSTKSRHMPGRGEMTYRSNLSLRAYIVTTTGPEGEERRKATVDPRRLTGSWQQFEVQKSQEELERIHVNRLVLLLRRNLRSYPGYEPSDPEEYAVSPDGQRITLPMKDLSALLDVAFGGGS